MFVRDLRSYYYNPLMYAFYQRTAKSRVNRGNTGRVRSARTPLMASRSSSVSRAVPKPPRPPLFPPRGDVAQDAVRITDPKELGQVIRWTRGVRRQPQEEAAAKLGISPDVLRGIERADRGVSFRTVLNVLARLGYDVLLMPRDPEALPLRERYLTLVGKAAAVHAAAGRGTLLMGPVPDSEADADPAEDRGSSREPKPNPHESWPASTDPSEDTP